MAKKIPQHFIDEVLGRLDIVEIIASYNITLKKTGHNFMACCPFHQEKTPSFSVNQKRQLYHCFGCGAGGNVINFLMDYEHLSFLETIDSLASQAGLSLPKDQAPQTLAKPTQDFNALLQTATQYYIQQLRQHPKANEAITYLKQRGVTGEIAKTYQIGYAPPGWENIKSTVALQHHNALLTAGMLIKKERGGTYDRFRERIMFPIRDHRGRYVGFGGRVLSNEHPKYLNSPETPVFHKSKILYGLYEALQYQRQAQDVFIVEGYLDVIALAQYNLAAVATLGTSTSSDHIKLLSRYYKKMIFCFDGDKAGFDAGFRALQAALPIMRDDVQIRFMFLPEGEDPDTLIRHAGKENFLEQAQKAQGIIEVLLHYLTQQADLHTLDGRSRLISLASPFIQQMSSSNLQFLCVEQLARLVHIPPERLQHLMKVERRETQQQEKKPWKMPNNIRFAFTLLLQYPHLIDHIKDTQWLETLSDNGFKLLKRLIQQLRDHPSITTAALLEHWRDTRFYKQLQTLATHPLHVPESGIVTEFCDTWERLQTQQQTRIIQTLLQKASQNNLSEEEKHQLQQLIQAQKQ